MKQPFNIKKAEVSLSGSEILWIVFIMFGWSFLWFAPWPVWLKTNLWLRTGIALAIFITPGGILYLLINREAIAKFRYITLGFIFSHLLVAILGTTGRIFQFPFTYVKNGFMTLGLIFIIIGIASKSHKGDASVSLRSFVIHSLSYWPIAIIAVLTILMTIQRVISSDDLAYLAHLTNWQYMPNLNFSDVYFNTTKIESTRFWIVSTPFSQAFLADIGKIPGLLLLSGYYEPFLAFISLFCFYDLAKTLGISHRYAMTSVAVQVAFMALLSDYLHPGAPFFHQLSTDKATAAFIFTPVFVISAIQVLSKSTRSSVTIFLLSGLSLTFMHPIISAFAVFIVCAVSFLGINRDNFKKHLIVIALAFTILTPQVGIRLIKSEAQPTIPTSINNFAQSNGLDSLIARLGDTPFYGFNPGILEMHIPYEERIPTPAQFFSWLWLMIPILAIFTSIRGLRNSFLKQYILATTLLMALAGIPFTGWILGYFVSAWMLERTTWLYPFGIGAIFLFLTLQNKTQLGERLKTWRVEIYKKIHLESETVIQVSIWMISIVPILLVMREQGLPNITRLQSSTQRYRELTQIGNQIDESTLRPVNIVGTDDLNDFIPTLSWKAKVISYRPEDTSYPYFYSEEEKFTRWSDRQAIFSKEISPDKRMEIIQKYNIRFILLESYRFGKVKDLISAYPMSFKTFSVGRYYLIEINDIDNAH